MVFLSANQEVAHGKIKKVIYYSKGRLKLPQPPPPSTPLACFCGLWEGQRQNQQKAVYMQNTLNCEPLHCTIKTTGQNCFSLTLLKLH